MTRELLYRAATELFVERGYEDTTMADIAERAGTARRTAFNHFPNKGDIPMMWARLMADRAVEAFAAHAEDRTVERIYAYFQHITRLVGSRPELSRQTLLGWVAAGGPIRYESQFLADLTPVLEAGPGRSGRRSRRPKVAALSHVGRACLCRRRVGPHPTRPAPPPAAATARRAARRGPNPDGDERGRAEKGRRERARGGA